MHLDKLVFVLVYVTVLGRCTASTTPAAVNLTNRTRPVFDENLSDKEILDDLLIRRAYDKRIIPPKHGPLTINVSVLLLSLASPDESSLKYEVEFLMRQTWTDPRLAYEAGAHTFLNALHHYESIWLPDTYFIKHGDFKEPLMPVHIALRVYKNGTILYIMRRHLILSCQGNLNIFPFDDPICRFSVESISYDRDQMVYLWNNDEGKLRKTPSLAALNAYLIHNQTSECPERFSWRGNLSCLMVELTFTRDKAFYFTTVFIPGVILVTPVIHHILVGMEWGGRNSTIYSISRGIILVTSSFITFWLEWNAVPARVLIGVTTMLNFFTTSNGFRSTLPVVNNLTAMNVWDGVCMCFIYASLLEFVAVNYVGRKRPSHNVTYRPGENSLIQQTDRKRDGAGELVTCTICGNAPCTHPANNGCSPEGRSRRTPTHPIRIAKTIDVVSRTVFPICFAAFLLFFFINYKGFHVHTED